MVNCRNCWQSRFFEYCGAEGMICMATQTIISIAQAEDDTADCEFYEYMDSDLS